MTGYKLFCSTDHSGGTFIYLKIDTAVSSVAITYWEINSVTVLIHMLSIGTFFSDRQHGL
jgi:hypothetical protein